MLHASGELKVSLLPMKVTCPPNKSVDLTCSYEYGEDLYIEFRIMPLDGSNVTASGGALSPIIRTPRGGSRTWTVRFGHTPSTVECLILQHPGNVLAMVTMSMIPGLGTV